MQTSKDINARVQSYLNDSSASSCSSMEADLSDLLTDNPASWVAFKALGNILEFEGDGASAIECYLGHIPIGVQSRFFKIEDLENISADIAIEYIDAHASKTTKPRSESIKNTGRLAHYENGFLHSAPTGVAKYTNSSLWFDGYNTAVFDCHGTVDSRTLIGNIAPVISASRQKVKTCIEGQVVLIGSKGSNNYYHWMTDILPKFAVLEKSGIKVNDDTKYIFTNVTSKFQIETLKYIGLRDEQIYCTSSQGEHVQADEILVPVLNNRMGFTMGDWLPEYIKSVYKNEKKTDSRDRKILVSRNAEVSNGRGIYNIAEFNQFFLDNGYEIISPENHTVAEQAQIFSQSSHVAGPHGAGLANLLFCEKETHVYEFYGEHLAPCYWAVSELSGLEYANLNCVRKGQTVQSALLQAKSLGDRRSMSFSVPLSELNLKYI